MRLRNMIGTAGRPWEGVEASPDFKPAIYGLDVEHHGGECCGVRHLYNFPCCMKNEISQAEKEAWLKQAIHRAIDTFGDFSDSDHDYDTWRGCIEVVLAESQMTGWCQALEDAGFKQVFSFLNHNSGNECFVFLLETNRPTGG